MLFEYLNTDGNIALILFVISLFYFPLVIMCVSIFFPTFNFLCLPFRFANSSFPCPPPPPPFSHRPTLPTPHIHPFILASIRRGEVLHTWVCLPREDTASFLSRGREKDDFSFAQSHPSNISGSKLIPAGNEGVKKNEKKKEERNHAKKTVTKRHRPRCFYAVS